MDLHDSEMVHDLSPFLWRIDGDFGVHWYGLAYLATFAVSYMLIRWLARRQNTGLSSQHALDFVTACAIGSLIGARLGYCFFSNLELLFKVRGSFPFWGVFALHEGGMDSQGAMIGAMMACLLFARTRGLNKLYLFDLVGVCAAIGLFFGRLANFVNGEFLGRVCGADVPLAMKYPTEIYQWPKVSPERLKELGAVVDTLPGESAKQWTSLLSDWAKDGNLIDRVNHMMMAIVEQVQMGNAATKAALAPLLPYRFPYQIFAASVQGFFLFVLIWIFWHRSRKAGVVGALFLFGFGFSTLLLDQFRAPEIGQGLQMMGLHRAHFAIIDIVVGSAFFFLWARSGSVVIPGWGRVQSIRINRRG